MRLDADAGGHGKTPDIIRLAALHRRDEVRQGVVGLPGWLDGLLTKMMQGGESLRARVIRVEVDVVTLAGGGEKADHGPGRQPFFLDQRGQHRLGILKEVARLFADDVVIENFRVTARQLPGMEERRPVDEVDQFLQGITIQGLDAQEGRLGRDII